MSTSLLLRPIVICGPSASGKSTRLAKLISLHPTSFRFTVTHTTRAPRPGEVDGKAYNFVTKKAFNELVSQNKFVEHAKVHGNQYGTTTAELYNASPNVCTLLDIDVQGVKSMKAVERKEGMQEGMALPYYVFVTPPNVETLRKRLRGRNTESEESFARRIEAAEGEMEFGMAKGNFDEVVVSTPIEEGGFETFLAAIKRANPTFID